jgi:hypothetical protein
MAAALAALSAPAQADIIYSVNFGPNAPFAGRAPVSFTGVESQAAAADSAFAASHIWNNLTDAPDPTFTTNPSFSGLVDSTGAASGVGISFTGSIGAANDVPIDSSGSNAVENEYFLIGGTDTASYAITGLPANTRVALYLYAPNFTLYDSGYPTNKPSRGYQLTANGSVISVASGPNDNALAFLTTDASGDISGVWSSGVNEGDLSGLQLAYGDTPVPEPSSVALAAGGILLALGGMRRRKRLIGR